MSLDFIKKYNEEDISEAEIKDFERWLKDESYIEEYGIYEFIKDDVLLRVYKYVPEEDTENPLFDDRGKPLGASKERVCAIAKVIKTGPNNNLDLKPGEHVALIDGVAIKTLNPKYSLFCDWSGGNKLRRSMEISGRNKSVREVAGNGDRWNIWDGFF